VASPFFHGCSIDYIAYLFSGQTALSEFSCALTDSLMFTNIKTQLCPQDLMTPKHFMVAFQHIFKLLKPVVFTVQELKH
jgi:hypothetical protein